MRILYLMHVDWHWIKQRPHYLAEELMASHEVMVAYRINPSRKSLCANASQIRKRYLIPFPRRYGKWSECVDSILQKGLLKLMERQFNPDLIWVTFPSLSTYLPNSLSNKPIVYDCMDDAVGFYREAAQRERVQRAEDRLCHDAAAVLCSSATLMRRLEARCPGDKFCLVRNGLPEDLVDRSSRLTGPIRAASSAGEKVKIAYVGAISSWFDFDSLLPLLDEFHNLELHLVGPADVTIPEHQRLVYRGVVDRTGLPAYVEQFDAFIMPFHVNKLIEGVDPVKLYEYLATGKPTLSVHYEEIDRFSDFVYFYRSQQELCNLLRGLCSGGLRPKARIDQVQDFLARNTWTERAREVERILAAVVAGNVNGCLAGKS